MIRKGRERPNRGLLQNFEDLPIERQEMFRNIKKILVEYFKKDIDVCVAGSHFYGYWDELSDYDVSINEKEFNYLELVDFIKSNSIQFHVVIMSVVMKNILVL
jgi:hypothetical protein